MNERSRRYAAVTGFSLIDTPYWTEADQAELDVLTQALVDVVFIHKERCPVCIDPDAVFCEPLVDALQVVLDWRRFRILRSKAISLRARQDFVDWTAAA